jgi:ubiquinone biosynthesis protein
MIHSPIRQLKRSTEISSILARYGFNEVFGDNEEPSETTLEVDEGTERPERLRLLLQELGPTFIKFGQIMSTRPDVLGPEYVEELEKLQCDAEAVDLKELRAQIEEAYDSTIEDVFESFDEIPLATASIAQVHRAVLKDGTAVVLKVRKPGITKIIDADLEIMKKLVHLAVKSRPNLEVHDLEGVFLYFKGLLEKELDFLNEAAQIERFQRQGAKSRLLTVPNVYREWCREEVLVMDFIEGQSLNHLLKNWTVSFDRHDAGRASAKLVLEQIFVHGYFHGDPHPGNIMITDEGKLCFLDFGLMGQLDRSTRWGMARLVEGISKKDEKAVVDALLDLTDWGALPDRKALEVDVLEYLTKHFYQPLEYLRLGEVLQELLDRITFHQLKLPAVVYMMIKSLSTMEGWVKELNPEIDIIELCRPYVTKARTEEMNPVRIGKSLVDTGLAITKMLEKLPRDTRQLLDSIREGEVHLKVEHKVFGEVDSLIDQVVTRLSSALIVAALIVGSSLIIHAHIPPLWKDVSILGAVGYILAGIEGTRILFSHIKKKK